MPAMLPRQRYDPTGKGTGPGMTRDTAFQKGTWEQVAARRRPKANAALGMRPAMTCMHTNLDTAAALGTPGAATAGPACVRPG